MTGLGGSSGQRSHWLVKGQENNHIYLRKVSVDPAWTGDKLLGYLEQGAQLGYDRCSPDQKQWGLELRKERRDWKGRERTEVPM